MLNLLLTSFGKVVTFVSQQFNLGNGSTWPGHIALSSNKNFIKDLLKNSHTKVILVVGTNGKTTTSTMLCSILTASEKKVIQNNSGANLLNGIASTLLLNTTLMGRLNADFAIFEIDENVLPLVLKQLHADYIIALNLFRDQLDRYGEIDTIASKWRKSFEKLDHTTTLIFNADDPQVAYLGNNLQTKTLYFGLNNILLGNHEPEHASDSLYCPRCSTKLTYHAVFFSHLGNWECHNCGNKRPVLTLSSSTYYPLSGIYNRYNTLAAILTAQQLGINEKIIKETLQHFSPAFGRQEIIKIGKKNVQLFLSKNPTSFNQSIRTARELGAKKILFVLNDRVPDGRDVSWIWDTDIERYINDTVEVFASGDRAFDMSVRLKYAHPAIKHVDTYPILEKILPELVEKLPDGETLYILPTYSAMLEVRKILTGKKIL